MAEAHTLSGLLLEGCYVPLPSFWEIWGFITLCMCGAGGQIEGLSFMCQGILF